MKPGTGEKLAAVVPLALLLGIAIGTFAAIQSPRATARPAAAPVLAPAPVEPLDRAASERDGDTCAPLLPLAPNLFMLQLPVASGRGK